MRTKVRQSQRSAETRCLFCHGDFIDEEELSCQCGALYHQDCYETYGCGTIGCSGFATKAKARLSSVTTPVTAIDARAKRFRLISNLWSVGTFIIGFFALLGAATALPLVEILLLVAGTIVSYVAGATFSHKARQSEKSKSK